MAYGMQGNGQHRKAHCAPAKAGRRTYHQSCLLPGTLSIRCLRPPFKCRPIERRLREDHLGSVTFGNIAQREQPDMQVLVRCQYAW